MRLTVGKKLMLAFVAILVLTVFAGWAALNLASKADESTGQIYRDEVVGLVGLSRAVSSANEVRRRGLLLVIANDPQTKQTLQSEGDTFIQKFQSETELLRKAWEGQEDKLVGLGAVEQAWEEYLPERAEAVRLSLAGKDEAAEVQTTTRTQVTFRKVEDSLHDLVRLNDEHARKTLEEARGDFSRGRNQVLGIFVLAILAGIALAVLLSRRIARNVGSVAEAAHGVAAGDLSLRANISTRDEIGSMAEAFNAMAERLEVMVEQERTSRELLQKAFNEYSAFAAKVAEGDLGVRVSSDAGGELEILADHLNQMVEGLAELSKEVRSGSHSIGSAATEILAAVNQHTASATQQSASINEITATTEQISAAAELVTEKARDLAKGAQKSVEVSDEATDSVEAIIEGMAQISERVALIAQGILELSEQTQRIGEITATVDDLADQSNLLALNAAIEAARAGEQGKGFAVVAEEVRNLAEQSKQAAAQVGVILSDIRKGTDAAVMSTEQGTKVVEKGSVLAESAGQSIQQLAEVIKEAAQGAQQIMASAHQQNVGMSQIGQAMTDINQGTTQFLSGAHQSQKAAEELTELARQLQALTDRYKV